MRRLPSVLLLLSLFQLSFVASCGDDATSPEDAGPPSFAKVMGAPPDHQTAVSDVAVLSDGTRLVVGTFSGRLHATGEPDSLDSGGGERVFLARFHPDGALKSWTQLAGGSVPISRMARDPDDNLLLIGTYSGTTNFGTGSRTSVGYDIIFAKMDKTGAAIWVQDASGSGSDFGLDIASAGDGSFYMTGIASTEMQVAGEDVGELGSAAGFVVKVQPNGVGHWQATAAGPGNSICSAVAVSEDGTVVVCGHNFLDGVEFAGEIFSNDGGYDGFIGRFDSNGAPLGSIHVGGSGTTLLNDVKTLDNDPIVTGEFAGTVDFDVDNSGGEKTSTGDNNAFVARYSKSGALRWVRTFSPGGNQVGSSLARLSGGHIAVYGWFEGTITIGSKTFTSNGGSDAFIARMDGNGQVLSANRIGGSGLEDSISGTASGSTMIVVGETRSNEVVFPNGSRPKKFGLIDGYIYQQP